MEKNRIYLQTFSDAMQKLRTVENQLKRVFEENTGMSLTRFQILCFVKDYGPTTQAKVAEYVGIDPAAITRHMKILEEKGYIKRERNENNGREIKVSFTKMSKEKLAALHASHKEAFEGKDKAGFDAGGCSVMASISEDDIRQLMDALSLLEEKIKA